MGKPLAEAKLSPYSPDAGLAGELANHRDKVSFALTQTESVPVSWWQQMPKFPAQRCHWDQLVTPGAKIEVPVFENGKRC